jgi:hypothetical protein
MMLHQFVMTHALAVLAQPHEREAIVRLEALAVELEGDERLADRVREPGAQRCVEQREPHHVARNRDAGELERAGKRPQDGDEGSERHDRREQSQAQAQRQLDEQAQVLGDALVGVIRAAVEQLQLVIRAPGEPVLQVALVQPLAPLDLEHLAQIGAIYGEADIKERKEGEQPDEAVELVGALFLDDVIEIVVPSVEPDVQIHQPERQPDHRGEQQEALAALLRHPVGLGERPESL